jgi:ribA/ribD-fused uncharacterized protein
MSKLDAILKTAQAAQQQQRQTGFKPTSQAPAQTKTTATQSQTQATGVQSILDRARQVQQQQRQTTGVQTTVPRTVTPMPTPTPVTTPTTTTRPTSRLRSVLEALGIASTQAQRAVTGVQAPVKQQTAETNRIVELLTQPKQKVPATPFKSDKPKTPVDSRVKTERDALVAEYNKLPRTSNAMPIVSRRNELRNRIDELTEQLGEEKRAWNWQDAMAYQGNATATRSAGNYLDAARNLATIVGQGPALNRYQAAQTAHSRGLISDAELEEARAAYEKSRTTMRDATSGIKAVADRLDNTSDEYGSMAQNVEGGTDLGRTALGAYGAGLDLAGDFALNRLLPGLGEYAMYARMYGGGVREQEERGGDEYRSAGKGLVSAISGWASNKLVGGAGNIYGKSAASSAIENALGRVATKYPVLGNRWVQRIAKGVLNTEGIEEALEDYLNYGADKYLGFDKNATIDKAEVKQDALIGWILGFIATGAEYTPDQKRQIVQDGIQYAENVETQEQADAAVLQAEGNAVQAEQRAEAQAPVVQPVETPQNTNAQETPVEATESISPATDESVPPSTQDSTEVAPVELNNGQSVKESEEQKRRDRIEASEAFIEQEAEHLKTDFEQDPVNVQRFRDGQGAYSDYPIADRLAVLQKLYPEEGYYRSGDQIVTERKGNDTTTGQSTAFGDMRTGSNHRVPKYKSSPKSNVPAPQASSASFDPQTVKAGDKLNHKTWGEVTVTDVQNGRVTVELPNGDTKTVVQTNMGNFFTPVQQAANSAVPQNENAQNSATEQSQTAAPKPTASNRITSFRGEHSFLSNFADSPIGPYKNAEAAFQAAKCVNESDRKKFEGISAKEAKRLGRQVKLRPDWERVKFDVMLDIVRQKFNNNPSLAQKLLATGDAELIEGNTWGDTTWGVNANTGEGQNALGKILMQVREELRSNAPAQQSAESGTIDTTEQSEDDELTGKTKSAKEKFERADAGSDEALIAEHDYFSGIDDLVSSLADASDAIEKFKKNLFPTYESFLYDSMEEAQADYNEIVGTLREIGLPTMNELDLYRDELEALQLELDDKRLKLAQDYSEEGHNDFQDFYRNPEVKQVEEKINRAETTISYINSLIDFLKKNPEIGNPDGGVSVEGTEAKGKKDGVGQLAPDNARGNGKGEEGKARPVPENAARENETRRKLAERRRKAADSKHRHEVQELDLYLSNEGIHVMPEENVSRIYPKIHEALVRLRTGFPHMTTYVTVDGDYGPACCWTDNGVIGVDALSFEKYCVAKGIPIEGALDHEKGHFLFAGSKISAVDLHEWLMNKVRGNKAAIKALTEARNWHASFAHKTSNASVKKNIKGGKANINLRDNTMQEKAKQWEEVFCDLFGGINRAFSAHGSKDNPKGWQLSNKEVSNSFDYLKELVQQYFNETVIPEYNHTHGLDYDATSTESNNLSESVSSVETEDEVSGAPDPGENASWSGSLKRQTPPPENTDVEREDDDMTPLNEMDQEREEERRKEQRKETEKRFGKENHKRLSDAYERFKKWADEWTNKFGTDVKDEKGHKVQDDDGNPVKESMLDDFVKNVKDMLDGEMSVQSFQEYYESLKPAEGENKGTDENYFYDPYLAAYLNQFANAERTANLTQTGADAEIARDEYLKQAEAFAGVFETMTRRLSDKFDDRIEMNAEVTENAEREVGGKEGAIRKHINWFKRIQSRPDLFFERLGGFDPKKSKVLYEIANRVKTGEKKLTNVRMGARQFFYDINSNPETAKAWRDMENGTTKGNVDIMGLGKVSLNYELALLKTLETNGAIDHIAENGAEFPNEADYYAGRNNNGWGETDHLKVKWTPEMLEQMARENLQKSQMMDDLLGSKPKKITFKDIQKEKVRILKDLRKQIKSDVMSSEIGRAAYEASVKSMQFMADEINDVTLRMYGIARALQGSNYWPMMVVGRGNNAQIMNNLAFNVEASSFLQHRKGGSGALHIVPFTEAMNNYITQASNFVAFGELSSDLNMMSKEIGVGYGANDSQKQSIQSVLKKEAGKGAAEYLTKWMETINGKHRDVSKFGTKMRSNLAQSSLLLNLGVAIKQTPSYFNAMGVIDPDILIKNRLMTFGALKSAKSYDSNPLIQAINSKTNILSSRKVGYNTVEMGEAIANGRSLSNKIMGKVPTWMTNWINKMDYRTVADLALACGEQVKRNHANDPDFKINSDAFYQETADLLEEAVVKTQPIYDAQFRPEYLRSDNEIVRMTSMFRTQQSQNYNSLVEAWGEYQAAKNSGDSETQQAAERKLKNVVAGQAVSTLAFSLLSTVARLVTHRTKDYEDEEGNFDFGKLAKRAGLDFLESAAAVVWFGDVAAKVAVDIGSNLGAKAVSAVTGNKVSGTNEFFSVSDNTISLINTFASSAITLAKNPTSPKAIKNAIFDGSQAAGIPTRNAYNLLNSVVMYGYDAIGKNDGNYDDMIDMWVTEGKMSDSTRATRTTEAAVKFYAKGDRNKANTLLGTLDYSNSDVMSSVKKALGSAYVDGDLSEDEYRRVLKNYIVPTTGDKIDDIIHDKNVDKAVAEYTENDPRKYNALIKAIDSAKKKTSNTSKSDAVARLIIDSAMEKNGRDAFMEKYTTSSYWTAYKAAEKQTGSPNRAVEALLGIDKNKDDTFSQDELYKFYLDNPKNFHLVQAIWDANGWSTSWNDYYKSKSRRLDYDRLANQNSSVTTFAEAEARLKELQSGARITLQKTDVDREMFDTILDLDMSDEDTDTTVNRYLSSGNRNNYNTLRVAGQSPEKSIEILKGIDTDEKGTISQKEMWAYYKAHPEDEAAIEALFNAQGYTGKTTKNWATFKKAKH